MQDCNQVLILTGIIFHSSMYVWSHASCLLGNRELVLALLADAMAQELHIDTRQLVGGELHPAIPMLHPAAYKVCALQVKAWYACHAVCTWAVYSACKGMLSIK